VAYRLSGGQAHITEPSFASRTGLMHLANRAWDPVLLDLFDIPASALPEIRPSDGLGCRVAVPDAREGIPIVSALGDQQAALYGHGGRRPGQAKITMGTGAFLWTNAGPTPPTPTSGLVATCAWAPHDRPPAYALEGFLPNAGAVVTWLRTLGLLDEDAWPDLGPAPVRHQHLQSLPAIAGLGTPYWAPHARAMIEGMDAGTTREDVVNACILGVVQLLADAIDSTTATVTTDLVMLDGGMSQNDSIAQALADLTGTTIHRSREEATATGIALLTAHALGLIPSDEGAVEHDAVFTPRIDTTARTDSPDRLARLHPPRTQDRRTNTRHDDSRQLKRRHRRRTTRGVRHGRRPTAAAARALVRHTRREWLTPCAPVSWLHVLPRLAHRVRCEDRLGDHRRLDREGRAVNGLLRAAGGLGDRQHVRS
jgi:glycerol kinase